MAVCPDILGKQGRINSFWMEKVEVISFNGLGGVNTQCVQDE
jgi:hypothetical protein